MTSKIILKDIKIFAYHGVLPEETIIGTYYLVNLELSADLSTAAASDDLNDTVSYADVNEIVHREMAIPSKLIEHVAGRILTAVGALSPKIETARIHLCKLAPPMRGELGAACVEFSQSYR